MNRSRVPRLAIVSDPLVQRGGAERVVEAMAEAFPEAPVYALLYSAATGPASLAPRITESWLGSVPGAASKHRLFLPFFPSAIESIDLRRYDIILSSHHTAAKGVLRNGEQRHVCYCHTPMRALWERPHEEAATLPALLRPAAHGLFRALRTWDVVTVPRVDRYLANSRTTQRRIAKHWGRDSEILHPPIDISRFTPSEGDPQAGDYYLIASRPVAYKRSELAIEAARSLGRRVVVVGGAARSEPSGSVEYLGHVNDAHLVELMRGARALLYPQLEDFGMTPLEMNAVGRPVVAFGGGGALETVVDGVTGVLALEQSVEAFSQAIVRAERLTFSSETLRRHAERFSKHAFIARLRAVIAEEAEQLSREQSFRTSEG